MLARVFYAAERLELSHRPVSRANAPGNVIDEFIVSLTETARAVGCSEGLGPRILSFTVINGARSDMLAH
jgi:hypothetical protein